MTQLANDVLQMLDFLNIEKINFVGLSLGGMIGQQFAIQYPNRLESLVLCNTACEMPPKDFWNRCRDIVLNEGMKAIAVDTLRYWFQPAFLRTDKFYPGVFHEMILRTDVQGYISCIEAIRDMDHAAMLSKIQTPTLIIAGNRDMACTVKQAAVLNHLIEDSQLIILKNAAHISNVELPYDFSNSIVSFILSLSYTYNIISL
jgi:3-oxoadipate enol-lactonase